MTPRSPIQKTHPQERMRDRPPAHLSIPRAALAPRSRYAATPFVAIAAEEAFRSAMKSVRPLELTFQRLGAGRPGSGGQGKRPEERSDATNGALAWYCYERNKESHDMSGWVLGGRSVPSRSPYLGSESEAKQKIQWKAPDHPVYSLVRSPPGRSIYSFPTGQ